MITSKPLRSAASSTIPPLAQLIILTPSLHFAIVASPVMTYGDEMEKKVSEKKMGNESSKGIVDEAAGMEERYHLYPQLIHQILFVENSSSFGELT